MFLLLLTCTVWLEPGSCVPLSRHRSHSHREERSDEEVFLRFDLATNTTAECVNSVGSNVSVGLSYRTPGGEWMNISSHTPGQCKVRLSAGYNNILISAYRLARETIYQYGANYWCRKMT